MQKISVNYVILFFELLLVVIRMILNRPLRRLWSRVDHCKHKLYKLVWRQQ
jgi:hypothetical protein